MERGTAGTLLLSADESLGSLWAVRSLRAAGYETWVAISRTDTYAARSRAAAGAVPVRDPMTDVDGHALDLAATAERLRADAVLPGTEASLRSATGRESSGEEEQRTESVRSPAPGEELHREPHRI